MTTPARSGLRNLSADPVLRVWHPRYFPNTTDNAIPKGVPGLSHKCVERKIALPDDGPEGANPQFIMIGHWDRDGGIRSSQLHDDMAASLPDLFKTMLLKNSARFSAG